MHCIPSHQGAVNSAPVSEAYRCSKWSHYCSQEEERILQCHSWWWAQHPAPTQQSQCVTPSNQNTWMFTMKDRVSVIWTEKDWFSMFYVEIWTQTIQMFNDLHTTVQVTHTWGINQSRECLLICGERCANHLLCQSNCFSVLGSVLSSATNLA